jgi:hypothetical protein
MLNDVMSKPRLLSPYLYTFSYLLYENPSFIIVSAETEYLSRRSWYRNINFIRDKANLFIALVQYPVSQIKITFQEIRIIATAPCIANQLRDVNKFCRRSWYIAAHIWKIYDFKIEVIPFIINFSTELIIVVKFEV